MSVVFADDGKKLASTDVDAEDDAFHLAFVPEGSYKLKVTKAQDVERTEVPNAPGSVPPFETKEKTLRNFGETTQAPVVTSDVQSLLIAVPKAGQTESAPTGATAQAADSGQSTTP